MSQFGCAQPSTYLPNFLFIIAATQEVQIGSKTGEKTYQTYYRYVPMVFCVMGLACHMPHVLWKSLESGRVTAVTKNALGRVPSETERSEISQTLAEYFAQTKGMHDMEAIGFVLCEMLSIAIVLGQMFLLDLFFKGTFSGLGLDALRTVFDDQMTRSEAMVTTFPR